MSTGPGPRSEPRSDSRPLGARCLAGATLIFALLTGSPGAFAAAPAEPRVRVDLVSEVRSVAPGTTFWVGVRQRIHPGWHTYWVNPGDSGEPMTVDWELPTGFSAGPVAWPHPHRIPVGPAMGFGYTDEVVLPIPITAPAGLARGTSVTLRAQASWLVCEKICIPEEALISLTLAVGPASPDAAGAGLLARARRAVPVPSPWPASFTTTPETVTFSVPAPGLRRERIADAWFYPLTWGTIDHAAAQTVDVTAKGLTLQTTRGALPAALEAPIDGVLVITERLDQGTARQAFLVRATPTGPGARWGLPGILVLALAGGLVLNAMPCVLPVLSVKALALVRHAGARRAVTAAHGLGYALGVLVSFAVLAGALLALRAGGERIGWGFQLQAPWFVTVLAYVFFAMALALSGMLPSSGRLTGLGQGLAARGGYTGSFFTGALATVAATPCTAPFMGTAVGFAVTQPWGTAFLIFEALGLGLALPFLLLSLMPAWRRFLPRPGPWMERLQQLLAFPLYASVAWLVWVLSQQVGPPGVAVVLAGLVLLGFAAWLRNAGRLASPPWRRATAGGAAVAVALTVATLGLVGRAVQESRPAEAPAGAHWEPFSPGRLAELRAAGTPVFVNFTAAWCVTCLVNERVALRSPAVAQAFADKGVVRLRGDWTRRDAQITDVLDAFGRNGVPLYLLYPRTGSASGGGAAIVLPQILTEDTVIQAVNKI
jgi:thiol:disulfide interchange protein